MLWPDVLSHDVINLTNVYISSEMDARRFEVGESIDSFGPIFRRQTVVDRLESVARLWVGSAHGSR